MRWGQGVALNNISDTTFNEGDSSEHGGHKVILDYHGDNNVIAGYQTNGNTSNPRYLLQIYGYMAIIVIFGGNKLTMEIKL